MNWDQIRKDWQQHKAAVQEKWDKITDADFATLNGNRDKIIELLQQRYGFKPLEADNQVTQLQTALVAKMLDAGPNFA